MTARLYAQGRVVEISDSDLTPGMAVVVVEQPSGETLYLNVPAEQAVAFARAGGFGADVRVMVEVVAPDRNEVAP